MSRQTTTAQPEKVDAPQLRKNQGLTLQRKCACGRHTVAGGECAECRENRLGLQRRSRNEALSPLLSAALPGLGQDFSQVKLRASEPIVQRMPEGETPLTEAAPAAEPAAPTPDVAPTPVAPTSVAPTPAEPTAEAAAPTETAVSTFIVEDDTRELGAGQMRKSEFLASLRPAVCAAAEAALAGTGRTTEGCPYLAHWFDYYSQRDAAHGERALRKYAPEAATATSAQGYIPIVAERVRQGVEQWAKTGEVTGVPEGVPSAAPAQPSAATAPVMPLARPGGARQTDNPQAIRTQLGNGRPLDSAVRTRMESAFGANFSHVRAHDDDNAANLSSSLNARAFTVGEHVAFGAGEYQPGTLLGDALIAHELAHVMQQGSASDAVAPLEVGQSSYNALEKDADRSAVGAIASLWDNAKGGLTNIAQNAIPRIRSGLRLQRCDEVEELGTDESPKIEARVSAEDEATLKEYKKLLEEGRINADDQAEVDKKIGEAEKHLREVKELEESGSGSKSLAGGTVVVMGGITADDVTGIGVADDVALPFLAVLALGAIAVSQLQRTSPKDLEKAAKEAEEAIRDAIEAARRATKKAKPEKGPKPDPKPEPKPGPEKTTDPIPPLPREPEGDKDKKEVNVMRFQVQWDTNNKGPTFSEVATAPSSTGVTTTQAVASLNAAVAKVTPAKAREAAEPAAASQRKWILARPPAGIAIGGYSKSVYFAYKSYTDARVDVENVRGHNLRT